jgi:flagellin
MANGIYEDTPDRDNAQLEVSALINQVTLIAENTRFNDVALIDGSFTGVTIQAGNTTSETIELSFIDVSANTYSGSNTFTGDVGSTVAAVSDTGLATTTSGSGTGATFDVVIDASDNLTLTLNAAGSGYAVGDTITIDGASITGGTTSDDDITVTVTGVGLGISLSTVATQSDATVAIGTMDTALQTIAGEQAKFGSLINRLNFSVANLSKASVMTEQAVGRIMDADFALETTNLSKQQILNQAATSMLAQANQSKQSILALLQ